MTDSLQGARLEGAPEEILRNNLKSKSLIILAGFAVAVPVRATAQAAAAETNELTVLDDDGFASPRAAALGGSIASMADDLDAAWQNPAGIGGFGLGKSAGKIPLARKVYFPHVLIGANTNTYSLNRSFRNENAANDPAVGKALIDATGGKRQYFRNTLSAGAVVGRLMFLPYYDTQLAAVPALDDNSNINVAHRTRAGQGVGFSFTEPKGLVSVGFFRNQFRQTESRGTATYEQLITKSGRDSFVSDNSQTFAVTDDTAGVLWRMNDKLAPTLGVTAHHFNNTNYKSQTDGVDSYVLKQDLTVGFSMIPKDRGDFHLAFCVEADRLMQKEIALSKKIHTGVEFTVGELPGSYALAALRAGWENAGPSFGLFLNGGLVNLEISSRAEDIGDGNKRVIERRLAGTVFVNVSEF
ncbi:hypothetical protein EBZ80_14100 [bacterium]|nr:hypothetical protein [bacterium]